MREKTTFQNPRKLNDKGIELMSDAYRHIKDEIHRDLKEYQDDMFLLDETDSSIYVDDYRDGYGIKYEITDTDVMTRDWLSEKLIVTPEAVKTGVVTKDSILDFVFNRIPKEAYQNLNKIIVIGDEEKDFDWLSDELERFPDTSYDLLEVHNLPDDNQLGINWHSDSIIVIHVGNIIKTTDEMIEDGDLYEWERNGFIIEGIKTTLAHEIRHLWQSNPYVGEEALQSFLDDPEEDAERFARDVVDGQFFYTR